MNNGEYLMKSVEVIVDVYAEKPLTAQLSEAAKGLLEESTRMGFNLRAEIDNTKLNKPVIMAKLIGNRVDGTVRRLRYNLTSETPGRVQG